MEIGLFNTGDRLNYSTQNYLTWGISVSRRHRRRRAAASPRRRGPPSLCRAPGAAAARGRAQAATWQAALQAPERASLQARLLPLTTGSCFWDDLVGSSGDARMAARQLLAAFGRGKANPLGLSWATARGAGRAPSGAAGEYIN